MPSLPQQREMQSERLARIPLPHEPLAALHRRAIVGQSEAFDVAVRRDTALAVGRGGRGLGDDRAGLGGGGGHRGATERLERSEGSEEREEEALEREMEGEEGWAESSRVESAH